MVGIERFLQRLWRNFFDADSGDWLVEEKAPDDELLKKLHRTIKAVTDAMDSMAYNVAIAKLIELNNTLVQRDRLPRAVAEDLVRMLSPFAPHVCEELWERLGHAPSVARATWPEYDERFLVEDEIELPVQVNGKMRGKVTVPAAADDATIEAAAKADPNVAAHLDGKTVRKVINVKGKLINLVVG